jgi:hypothetical protein
MLCYQKLITRNQQSLDRYSGEKRYQLPFLIFSTKDNNQQIDCHFKDPELKTHLYLGTDEGFEVLGDIDLCLSNHKFKLASVDEINNPFYQKCFGLLRKS